MNKKTISLLVAFAFACNAFAVDVAEIVKQLDSNDYKARMVAREELKNAMATASSPGTDPTELVSLQGEVINYLGSFQPQSTRLWMIRMLELFGNEDAAEPLNRLLNDSDDTVNDAARKALGAIPGSQATKYLEAALSSAPIDQKSEYINALVYRGDEASAKTIAVWLTSKDESLAIQAAQGLGKLGTVEAIPLLLSTSKTATPAAKIVMEGALLDIGVDADTAYQLAGTGANASIRAGAFAELTKQDSVRAMKALSAIRNDPAFLGRPAILREAMAIGPEAMQLSLVSDLPNMTFEDQVVILGAISDYSLTQFEPQVIALLAGASGNLQKAVISTLGVIGGDQSYDPIYQAYLASPSDKNITYAFASLKAPSTDAQLLETVKSGDVSGQVAALKILQLRNTPGVMELTNQFASPDNDDQLRQTAFKSMEKIGNVESARIMLSLIENNDPLTRQIQGSLKKLSVRLEEPDYLWEEIYSPALENAEDDKTRENIIIILDGVAGKESLNYVKGLIADDSSSLRPIALRSLQRWPNIDAGQIWFGMMTADGVSDSDFATAQKGLKRVLTSSSVKGPEDQRVKLAAEVIQNDSSSTEFKETILSGFKKPKWNQKKHIKKHFQPLLEDQEIAVTVQSIIDKC
ncbi:HEAT repeat domain-containing protein [Rubellicoccus peritrichatus]|uniref:HEAT repeat domain-containing protein n=1 Tax=Rubellicoccus peritrichatus TaxID=3080537 RepID=A0AAQ3L656_9BACT|nr:HEAT repeat domain-containing protein [Puniceicoccus sp. CR14]WOO40199.1 HEAT repeat domain-containing protein [Puniceicoccus sp. CR14]